MLKLAFSILLLIAARIACAQTDSTKASAKKMIITDNRVLNGIRVGVDVAGIGYGIITKSETFEVSRRYEINGDLGIKRWFVTLDLGTGTFERLDSIPNYNPYTSTGTYLRIGGDYRISKSAKSFLFIGVRFGNSFFSEKGTLTIPSWPHDTLDLRPSSSHNFDRKFGARWMELTPGIKVHLWNNFYMGYTIRFKFLLPSKKMREEQPLDIPGYGVGNRNTNLGFSFHLMYRIPFGKDPVIPMKLR